MKIALKKNCPIIWEFHFHKMLFGENVGAIVVTGYATDNDDDEPIISFSFKFVFRNSPCPINFILCWTIKN